VQRTLQDQPGLSIGLVFESYSIMGSIIESYARRPPILTRMELLNRRLAGRFAMVAAGPGAASYRKIVLSHTIFACVPFCELNFIFDLGRWRTPPKTFGPSVEILHMTIAHSRVHFEAASDVSAVAKLMCTGRNRTLTRPACRGLRNNPTSPIQHRFPDRTRETRSL
jgi:hypothetical protein